jgi:uncharacterized protein YjiS (DUF1127 family)
MAATFKLTPAQTSPSVFPSAVAVLVTGLKAISRALKNRRDAGLLATMDDRMLADIGLTRSDLRDAYAEPLWRDPTDVLAGRVSDKRRFRPRRGDGRDISAPSIAPDQCYPAPQTNRAARQTI